MPCLTCAHGALRDPADAERDKQLRKMARMGLVNCLKSPGRATFMRAGGECATYAEADKAVTEGRRKWAEKHG